MLAVMRATILLLLAGCIIVPVGLFLYSYLQPSSQIDLVFPDGFRGLAKLRGKKEGGIDLHKKDGVYVVRFPLNGVLDIRGSLPTMKWHVLTARFANGNVIPVAGSEAQVGKDDIALRQAGLFENREDWFVVGDENDMKVAFEQKHGFKWSP